jgi:hypothetical protein
VAKLRGGTRQNGTAAVCTLPLDDVLVLPVPWCVSDTPLITNVLTWATLTSNYHLRQANRCLRLATNLHPPSS